MVCVIDVPASERQVSTKAAVVISTKKSKKIVSELLLTELAMPVIGVVFKANQLTGGIH